MRYVLTFVVDQSRMKDATEEEMNAAMEARTAFDREAIEAGVFIACEPLEDASAATTIRIQEDGERVVTDGPYAESKEQLGGFFLLECDGLDEALGWANKAPLNSGSIEVRQVMDLSPYGYESSTPTPVRAAR